jgi:septal ring factor EnvC (AmiA/AmiB activator)
MEASAKELEALLERLDAARREALARAEADRGDGTREVFVPSASLESLRGRLPWPVEGDVLTTFGRSRHPRYGTSTYNSGVDIGARRGEGIRAVAAGQVEFVDWVPGYGKTVILSHGGGYYSLYAHASQVLVRVGDHIDAGSTIARVGDTDSLHGDCLHFELRRGGQAIDPIPWLTR